MIAALPLDLLCAGLIFFSALTLGRTVLHLSGVRAPWGLLQVLAAGAGLWAISSLVFLLAFLGLAHGRAFALALLLILALTYRETIAILAEARQWRIAPPEFWQGKKDAVLVCLLAAALLSNLAFNYAPPTQAREMLYDLTLPKIYLQNHRILDLPYQKEFYYPLGIQMLYLLAMAVRGVLAAKLIHYGLGVLSLGAVYFLARALFGGRAAFYSALIFYLMPLVASLSGTANVDFGTLFFGLLAFCALAIWDRDLEPRFLALAGFFAGAALATKVTGFAAVGACFLFAAVRLVRSSLPWPGRARQICLCAAFCALAFSPWLFRSVWFTGNPFAPFSVPALGLKGHAAADLEIAELAAPNWAAGWRQNLAGLHNLVFGDFIFGGGPLLFAFFLPAFTSQPSRRPAVLAGTFALLNFLILFFFLPYPHRYYENRYYGVSTALVALVSGAGLAAAREAFSRRWIDAAVFLGLTFPGLAFTLLFSLKRVPLLLGRVSQESYLRQKLPFYSVIEFANRRFNGSERVMMLGSTDAHCYYWNALVVGPSYGIMRESDDEKIVSRLAAIGITHVLFFHNFLKAESPGLYANIQSPGQSVRWNLERLARTRFEEIYRDADVALYAVRY